MSKYLVIFDEAICHIWLCNRSRLNFLIYIWGKFNFLSYQCGLRQESRGNIYWMRPKMFLLFFLCEVWGIFLLMSTFSSLNRFKGTVPRYFLREFSVKFELTCGTLIHEKTWSKNLVTHCPFNWHHAVALPPLAISAGYGLMVMSYLPYFSLIPSFLVLQVELAIANWWERGREPSSWKGKLARGSFFCIFVSLLIHVPDLSPNSSWSVFLFQSLWRPSFPRHNIHSDLYGQILLIS